MRSSTTRPPSSSARVTGYSAADAYAAITHPEPPSPGSVTFIPTTTPDGDSTACAPSTGARSPGQARGATAETTRVRPSCPSRTPCRTAEARSSPSRQKCSGASPGQVTLPPESVENRQAGSSTGPRSVVNVPVLQTAPVTFAGRRACPGRMSRVIALYAAAAETAVTVAEPSGSSHSDGGGVSAGSSAAGSNGPSAFASALRSGRSDVTTSGRGFPPAGKSRHVFTAA
ncbi:hypothetical protein ACFQ0B_67510 [Nonomuraea thailandensis]